MIHSGSVSGTYNRLPDVIDAHSRLNSMNKAAILQSLSEVIFRHNLQDTVGIRLLHSHNSIDDDEIMLEREEMNSGKEFSLSTVATKLNSGEPVFANSWKLNENEIVPLEFSLDPIVVAESGTVVNNKEFFCDFYETLQAFGVADLLGPCIVYRDFYEKRSVGDPDKVIVVERSDEKRRANVLKFFPVGEFSQGSLIETTWPAMIADESISMITCRRISCITRCSFIIHCDPLEGGGHESTTKHGSKYHEENHERIYD